MPKPFRYWEHSNTTDKLSALNGARDRQMVNWYIICQMVSAVKKARKGNGMREFAALTRVVREGIANKDGI